MEILNGQEVGLNYSITKSMLWLNVTELSTAKSHNSIVSFGSTFDYDQNQLIKEKTLSESRILKG